MKLLQKNFVISLGLPTFKIERLKKNKYRNDHDSTNSAILFDALEFVQTIIPQKFLGIPTKLWQKKNKPCLGLELFSFLWLQSPHVLLIQATLPD